MSQKKYIQLKFKTASREQIDLLIALLSEQGFDSFEEADLLLTCSVAEADFDPDGLASVLEIVPVEYERTVIEEENWNARWESSFEPIVVNDKVVVRADFHQQVPHVKYDIVITPKMSFGTGHHATTYMMIEQMDALDFTGKKVVDYGTGTAVLAILAEKMGATEVDAIDYDDWCIENGNENLAANGCSCINMIKSDTIDTGKTYDVILANINLNVILGNLNQIVSCADKGTALLVSGFLHSDEEQIKSTLNNSGFAHANTIRRGEWICILARFN